jgi:hypothetical protein
VEEIDSSPSPLPSAAPCCGHAAAVVIAVHRLQYDLQRTPEYSPLYTNRIHARSGECQA